MTTLKLVYFLAHKKNRKVVWERCIPFNQGLNASRALQQVCRKKFGVCRDSDLILWDVRLSFDEWSNDLIKVGKPSPDLDINEYLTKVCAIPFVNSRIAHEKKVAWGLDFFAVNSDELLMTINLPVEMTNEIRAALARPQADPLARSYRVTKRAVLAILRHVKIQAPSGKWIAYIGKERIWVKLLTLQPGLWRSR